MSTLPRIVATSGAPYPQARIDSIGAAAGVCVFAWLDSAGKQVDSGGSIARFAPLDPLPTDPGAPVAYPEVDDSTLVAAIANPPAASPASVPSEVTPRQIRLQLLTLGITDAMIRGQLASNAAALIEWDYSLAIRRDHPLVAQLGAALGLTSAQVDDAFRAAALL